MTLLEPPPKLFAERSLPVLETARLVLRAPTLADARNTGDAGQRPPHRRDDHAHPYPTRSRTRRRSLRRHRGDGETVYLITARDASILGACGIARRAGQRPSSAIGWVCPIGAMATPPKPPAP